jgi:hypothetical protein
MSKCIEIKPPNKIISKEGYKTVFLAGSIEMFFRLLVIQ